MTTSAFGRYRGSPPELYERHFVPTIGLPWGMAVLDAAGLRPGEQVLDVACGTGVVARLAAERVGPTGMVAGVDVHPGMIEVARSHPAGTSVDWYEGNAENLPLPDAAFDATVCSLALQFFGDKVRALREMRRVLAPGGRAVVSTSGPTPPLFTLLDEALARHVGPEAASFVRRVFSLHDPAELRELLRDAGFRDIDVRTGTLSLHLPAPAEFLWQYIQSTPLSAAVAELGDETRVALERDVVRASEPLLTDGVLTVRPGMLLATARN